MKKWINKLAGLTALAAMAFLSSCGGNRGARIEALPCAADSSGYNAITAEGSVIDLGLANQKVSPIVNGFFSASTPDGVTVYAMTDDGPQAVEGLSGLQSAGYMSQGRMPVCRQGGHIEIVDDKGRTVATLELPSGAITETAPCYTAGVLKVTTDQGLQGLVDREGKMVVEPKYVSLGDVSAEGLMLAMTEVENTTGVEQRFEVIDTDGEVRHKFNADESPVSETVSGDKVVVSCPRGFAVIDVVSGAATMLPSAVDLIDEVRDGFIVYRGNDGRKGLIDMAGNELLPAAYRQLRIGRDKLLLANDGKCWLLLDDKGNTLKRMEGFDLLSPVPIEAEAAGFAFVGRTPQGYYLIGRDGAKVGDSPMWKIDYGRLSMPMVVASYPTATGETELPVEEDWE